MTANTHTMKKLVTLMLLAVTFGAMGSGHSGNTSEAYWVIESSKGKRNEQLVKFYDGAHKLIYEENIRGKRLRPTDPSVHRKLNTALFAFLAARTGSGELISAAFRK
jgi:hypothetical protein